MAAAEHERRLEAVTAAVLELARAERVYRSALLAAVEAGASLAEVGRAAGCSRQAVHQLVRASRGAA